MPTTLATFAPLIGGALGGLFGGGEAELPPEMQRLLRMMMKQIRETQAYGRSAPMTDPLERQNLASQQAALGRLLSNQRERGYAAFGGPGSPNQGNLADFMSNLASSEVAQQSNVQSNAMNQALQQRFNARFSQVPGLIQNAAGIAGGQRLQQQGPDLGAILGQLGQTIAYGQAQREPRQTNPGGFQQGNFYDGPNFYEGDSRFGPQMTLPAVPTGGVPAQGTLPNMGGTNMPNSAPSNPNAALDGARSMMAVRNNVYDPRLRPYGF